MFTAMSRMIIRATYALDKETDHRIRELSRAWHVSQAEVVRRSVRAAAEQAEQTLTPTDVVKRYVEGPLPRSPEETRRRIEHLRQWRHADDERRMARD
jgi:hypothetical protein